MRRLLLLVAEAIALFAIAFAPPAWAEGTLVDQRGAPFNLDSFRGHTLVISFVSAHCSDACPVLDAIVAQTARLAREQRRNLRFVTVTIDPDRDTLDDMRAIARAFDADPSWWRIVGGSPHAVHAFMHRFGVQFARTSPGIEHETLVYVVSASRSIERTLIPAYDLAAQLQRAEVW